MAPSFFSRVSRRIRALPRHPRQFDGALLLHGAFDALGWGRSFRSERAVDAEGHAVPWLPYPVISWLSDWVNSETTVLEFGGGQSTLWFSQRAQRVDTIESDAQWATDLAANAPDRASIRHVAAAALKEHRHDPTAAIDKFELRPPYDLVLVDGAERPSCLDLAVWLVAETGVIVLDNSDRLEYQSSIEALTDDGYHRLDITGAIPGGTSLSRSTLLFRRLGPWCTPPRR